MKNIKLKICGMKHNIAEVAALKPDYLGFIFYEASARNFNDDVISISNEIKRVGVFVDASISFVLKNIKKYNLDVVQLHGDEPVFYINEINQNIFNLSTKSIPALGVEVWKVFSVDNTFDFDKLGAYEKVVDKFLFDTKGKDKGGNGFTFDWSILNTYPSTKPFILSGGISLENISEVKKLLNRNLPIYAIDVNSKFEIEPGLKDITLLKKLANQIV